jgi:hypothetical protein
MPRAPLLIVIAPLFACAGTIAAAQSERQWVDPPASVSEPALEQPGSAEALYPAAASRERSLEPSSTGKGKKAPVIQSGARAPAIRRDAEARRPEPSRSAERSTKPPTRKGRLARVAPRPSFNCRSARTSVERAIVQIRRLPRKIAEWPAYTSKPAGPGKAPSIDRNGGGWLRAMPVAVLQGCGLASIKCITRA